MHPGCDPCVTRNDLQIINLIWIFAGMNIRINKRAVDAIEPADTDKSYYDDTLKGFGVRVRSSGRKTYFVMGRNRGKQRRINIGAHGAMTTEQARKRAREILADLAEDKNPTEERDAYKKAPTVEVMAERFMTDYVPHHCKTSTAAEYRRSVDLFIIPKMGKMFVRDVKRADVIAFHHSMRDIPYQANRTLGVLSVMFSQAEAWGLRDEFTNPCRGVKKFHEEKRERFLSSEELAWLGEVLKDEEHYAPSAVACIRLLLLTGCRLREIQTLQWRYVDLTHQMIHLPDSKTGKKTIYLGEAAVALLKSMSRVDGNPHVITGRLDGQHLTDMQKPWRRIRKAAGLDDVRIHDLRHTFASSGIAIGEGLPVIGNLLGHTQAQTTARYTHLANHHAIEAANRISSQVANALQ